MAPTAVDSGQAALDALIGGRACRQPFVLVLLDANMPDLDGFDVAQEIAAPARAGRRDDHDADLVAASTAMPLVAASSALPAYLTKPIRQAELC